MGGRVRSSVREFIRWRGTDALRHVAQKAAEAMDENAWASWREVQRAVRQLLTETAPPGRTQHSTITDKKIRRALSSFPYRVGGSRPLPSEFHAACQVTPR
jgi:hypothetical protein